MKQRYEDQIKSLQSDIVTLVEGNSTEQLTVKARWQIKLAVERQLWVDTDANSDTLNGINAILPPMNTENKTVDIGDWLPSPDVIKKAFKKPTLFINQNTL